MSLGSYLNFILSLVFVLGLIGLIAWAYQRFFAGKGFSARLSSGARLNVIETRSLDARHKLILIRRDDTEHLLLLGPGVSSVVETGIAPPSGNSNISDPQGGRQ